MHFLEMQTERTMIDYVLKHTEYLVPYFYPFSKLAKRFLKLLIDLWGKSPDSSTKLLAFINVRQLATKMPNPFPDSCMKGLYINFMHNCKFMNPKTAPFISLMSNCVIELYALNQISAYQHAFVNIRQLAILLRNAIQTRTKEAFQTVYNWQFINSLRLWTTFLSRSYSEQNLSHLIYPFVQIVFGVIRLLPSSRYFPLQFHCVRMLHDIAEATSLFLNTAPCLLEMLDCVELKSYHKRSKSTRPLDFTYLLKVSKSSLQSAPFQDALIHSIHGLLLQYFSIYSCSVAFPELIIPAVNWLKRFNKQCKVSRFKQKFLQLIELLEKNAQFVTMRRQATDCSPRELGRVSGVLEDAKELNPLYQFYQRYSANERNLRKVHNYDYEEEKKMQTGEDSNSVEDETILSGEDSCTTNKRKRKLGRKQKYNVNDRLENRDTQLNESKETKRRKKENAANGDILKDFEFSDDDDNDDDDDE